MQPDTQSDSTLSLRKCKFGKWWINGQHWIKLYWPFPDLTFFWLRLSHLTQHAPLLDISYWLDAAADLIDLIHHNSFIVRMRLQIKFKCITTKFYALLVFWFIIKLNLIVGLINKRTINYFLHLLLRFFFSWCYFLH